MMKYIPLQKKGLSNDQIRELKFSDTSLLACYLDMLDSYIGEYYDSPNMDQQTYYDLVEIRAVSDYAYNSNIHVYESIAKISNLMKTSVENDIIVSQCKLAMFALMSV